MAGARRFRILLLATVLAVLAAATSAQAQVPREFFGVSAVRPSAPDYAAMAELGLGTHRVEVNWRTVEAVEGGVPNWNGPDTRFRAAAEAGLKPLPIVFGTPAWINAEGLYVPPVRKQRHRAAWKRFVTAFYLRYGPGGAFWAEHPSLDSALAPAELILWNEQNARAFWHRKADPGEYATLLRITDDALRPQFADARIVVGGMYGYPGNRHSMKMTRYLKRLYRKPGVTAAADGLALHPYAGGVGGVKKQIKQGRRIMRAAGEGNEGLWISEIGWASSGKSAGGETFLIKNEKQQARLLLRSYRLLLQKRERWRVRAAVWFTWRDYGGAEVCAWCPRAGLLERNADPKPAADAYRALIEART